MAGSRPTRPATALGLPGSVNTEWGPIAALSPSPSRSAGKGFRPPPPPPSWKACRAALGPASCPLPRYPTTHSSNLALLGAWHVDLGLQGKTWD